MGWEAEVGLVCLKERKRLWGRREARLEPEGRESWERRSGEASLGRQQAGWPLEGQGIGMLVGWSGEGGLKHRG